MNNRRRMMIKSAELRHHKRIPKDVRFWCEIVKSAKLLLWELHNVVWKVMQESNDENG